MLQFEGTRDFAKPVEEVCSRLGDATFLARCIPGIESVAQSDADKVICTLRPGFAFVRGTLELTVQVLQRVESSTVRLSLFSKGIGSTSEVEAALDTAPNDTGTRLQWKAEIKNLGGLLKAVPQGLIKASAQKVIADALTAVEKQMEAS